MHAPRTRVPRRPVHGVLLLDKPLGLSSNDALQKAKWLLRAEKAGHTGTLDPLATGVLPLCFGAATKFSHLQLQASKTYHALLNLGVTTRTADAEGEVLQRRPVPLLDAALVSEVLANFTGTIWQLPPMHSALKKDGKPLYEYARAGVDVTRERRQVEIHALRRLDPAGLTAEQLAIEVRCSKGTYIRTLAEDIGEALGCGAHLGALRRTASGDFDLTRCVTLPELEAAPEGQRERWLLPVDELLLGVPRVTLSAAEAGRFLSGLRRRGHGADAALVAVFGSDPPSLLGSAHVRAGELIPGRLLNPIEISQMNSL